MAKFSQGILGGFSGKIGNVVGGSWKGIDYMRSRPNKVKNPNTQAQQTQRGKFGLMMGFLSEIKPVIQVGFKSDTSQQTAFNSALSYNLKKAASGTAPDIMIDFPALMVTRGRLMPPTDASASADTEGEVHISWVNNTGIGNAALDDEAVILLYNTDRGQAMYLAGGGPVRDDESYNFSVPASYAGETVEVYLGFVSTDGKEASDSEYLGSPVLAEATGT